jgi:serine/threonine protein kinase
VSDNPEKKKVVVDLAAAPARAATPASTPAVEQTASPEGELSFEDLQAQLRQFKDAPQPEATISGDPDDKTRKDPNAPKHRGVLESDYEGPSYSELKRRAQASGNDENRLSLPVGYMLQEYRIEKVLGIGGFGVSYLAHDTNLNSKVAIKEYLPNDLAVRNEETAAVWAKSSADNEEYRIGLDRFLLESRTLATFRHPNIVRVNRFFEANNTAYMVMDYEFGESLNAWMKKRLERGDPPPDEAALLQMIVPLIQGLDKVHEAGFLHRDIKPANIYVRDSDGSLVLLDFGAARQTASAEKEGMTSIVTPGYAPFEQYHSHGRQGPWSDLYAMGGVLYWFVAGRKPIEAAARIQSDPQEPAVEIGKDKYSEAFLKAIDWALLPDDQKRPQSVSEFLPVLIGDNQMGPIGTTTTVKKIPLWMKLGFAAVTVVAVAAVGLNFMKPGRGLGGGVIKFGINPGVARMTDDAQIRAKLDGFFQEVQKGTKRVVEMELTQEFKPGEDGKPKYDLIMGVTDKLGAAVRDYGYLPVARFRDLNVHYYVKADGKYAGIKNISEVKGLKIGVYSRSSTVGPIAINWLVVNDVPVDASHITEFKNQDEIADALMENQVDVIGVSPNEGEAARKKYGKRLQQIGESEPFPGYGLAVAPTMPKDQAERLTQVLWKLHESPEGRAALDNFDIGSSANTTQLRESNKREYEKALSQLERARKLYPAAAPGK